MKSPIYKALTWQAILVLLVVLGNRAWSAGLPSFPVTNTLPPVHVTCTQVNQRTGTSSHQGFILNLRANSAATLQLQGLHTVLVQVCGKQTAGGVQLQYSVVDRGQTYGPARLLIAPDGDPIQNSYYMDDIALSLSFGPPPAPRHGLGPVSRSNINTSAPSPQPSTDPCHKCHGTGVCQTCGGQGHTACTTCNGNGLCIHCQGAAICTACAGTGAIYGHKCMTCNGTGACQYCNTRGTTIVPGDGMCPDCHGKGYMAVCAACNGTGECRTCKGTGKTRLAQ